MKITLNRPSERYYPIRGISRCALAHVVVHNSIRFPLGLSRRDHNWLAITVSKVFGSPRACLGGSND